MITLHYYPSNASFAPHVVLHELGIEFELALVDREAGAHKRAEYLKLNPNGLIPVLVDGDNVLYEAAAICLHLADTHPQAGLAPALGSPERAQMYKWVIWLTNTMQAMLIHYFYPDRMVAPGNAEGAEQVKVQARAKLGEHLSQVDAQLAGHGGPWLLGSQYTIADPICFMLCRWTRGFITRPARDYEHIGPYMKRVLERPAVQRAVATEKLPQPIY
ncbi:MAG TPA: glutathione S-transferase family protein [Rubrivivax sp.]|jgi:glutathione S-transferase|nr:glutathione S-transferase family protein [Rubrivivax sp.]